MNNSESMEKLIEDLIRKLARANVELYYLTQRVALLEKKASEDKPQAAANNRISFMTTKQN
ncbi:hypothetical protein FZC79_10810 [Rossellomorea vietnamensis]|uniref:Uncharacterized protein n=1 Tax=Rossellomorea vietnamensis TaxID=218284 RepID=A0A5D4KCV8_9BACI|nr:hypothetical protein [Rossellomorea vietnamensis]TYR75247.1 hypothetical protein FZC79_10810 [Rossellomorea vietnamensis]